MVLYSQQKTPAVPANIQDVETIEILGLMMFGCMVFFREVAQQPEEFRCIRSITTAEQQLAFCSIRLQRAKQTRVITVVQTVIAAMNAPIMRQRLLRHVPRPCRDASHAMWLNSIAMEFLPRSKFLAKAVMYTVRVSDEVSVEILKGTFIGSR